MENDIQTWDYQQPLSGLTIGPYFFLCGGKGWHFFGGGNLQIPMIFYDFNIWKWMYIDVCTCLTFGKGRALIKEIAMAFKKIRHHVEEK